MLDMINVLGPVGFIVISLVTFLFGITIGSFLNVCIYRIPLDEDIAVERSHCMKCGHILKWYELVPLFSWIIQGGKCRSCKQKISIQYPIVEAGNAILWLMVLYTNGLTWQTLIYFFCSSCMIVISVIDERTHEINIFLNIFIAVLGVVNLVLDYKNWIYYVIGMLCVSVVLLIIVIVSKERAMGLGDVYLMAASGLLLGWKHTICAFVLACVLGSIIHLIRMAASKKKDHVLALGPYLCLGIYFTMLFGNYIIDWYSNFLHFDF